MIWLEFEEPLGHPWLQNEDYKELELLIAVQASQLNSLVLRLQSAFRQQFSTETALFRALSDFYAAADGRHMELVAQCWHGLHRF